MSRIYLTRDRTTPRLVLGEVKKALDAHFGLSRPRGEPEHPQAGQVHDIFSPQGPWITYDTVTTDDLRQAAEFYWPYGGWEVVHVWRASADGARPASTPLTAPVGPAGRVAAARVIGQTVCPVTPDMSGLRGRSTDSPT